jgi:hypothetical protein
MKYQCCWVERDPNSWTEIDAYDRELAATEYVKQLCARDAESYSSFAGGELVLVKIVGGTARAYEVTLEMIPSFTARPRL